MISIVVAMGLGQGALASQAKSVVSETSLLDVARNAKAVLCQIDAPNLASDDGTTYFSSYGSDSTAFSLLDSRSPSTESITAGFLKSPLPLMTWTTSQSHYNQRYFKPSDLAGIGQVKPIAALDRDHLVAFEDQRISLARTQSFGVSIFNFKARGKRPNREFPFEMNTPRVYTFVGANSSKRGTVEVAFALKPSWNSKSSTLEGWRLDSTGFHKSGTFAGRRLPMTSFPSGISVGAFSPEPPADFDPTTLKVLYRSGSERPFYEYDLARKRQTRLAPVPSPKNYNRPFYWRGRLFLQQSATGDANGAAELYEASPDRKHWIDDGPYLRLAGSTSGKYWLVKRGSDDTLWLWRF